MEKEGRDSDEEIVREGTVGRDKGEWKVGGIVLITNEGTGVAEAHAICSIS